MIDGHKRSFLKGLTWRVVATLDTILISFIITGKLNLAVKIGIVELMTKTFLYYFHERIWLKIWLWKDRTTHKEHHYRSILKAVSWRFFGTTDTFIIALIITHRFMFGLSIGITEFFTKITLYYLHERVWSLIKRGRNLPIDQE